MRRTRVAILVTTVLLVVTSCAGITDLDDRSGPEALARGEMGDTRYGKTLGDNAPDDHGQKAGGLAAVQDPVRKVIYDADVTVVVEDHQKAASELEKWVNEAGGYVSGRDLDKRSGDAVTMTLTVRLPADRFGGAMKRIGELGYVTSEQTRSDDVTEDYYDVQARLENARRAENQLLSIMEQKAGTLEEYLAVQHELSEVREKIETLEGKLRVWDDLVDLSTITVVMQEDAQYAPPPPPTFGSRISGGFHGSVKALWSFVQALVVVGAVLAPWLGVLAVLLSPLVVLALVLGRRVRRAQPQAA